jgi:hypothetical protein
MDYVFLIAAFLVTGTLLLVRLHWLRRSQESWIMPEHLHKEFWRRVMGRSYKGFLGEAQRHNTEWSMVLSNLCNARSNPEDLEQIAGAYDKRGVAAEKKLDKIDGLSHLLFIGSAAIIALLGATSGYNHIAYPILLSVVIITMSYLRVNIWFRRESLLVEWRKSRWQIDQISRIFISQHRAQALHKELWGRYDKYTVGLPN